MRVALVIDVDVPTAFEGIEIAEMGSKIPVQYVAGKAWKKFEG